jgi:hypothetical protein
MGISEEGLMLVAVTPGEGDLRPLEVGSAVAVVIMLEGDC